MLGDGYFIIQKKSYVPVINKVEKWRCKLIFNLPRSLGHNWWTCFIKWFC